MYSLLRNSYPPYRARGCSNDFRIMEIEQEKRGPGRPRGQPKTGGRKKGTPNKVTGDLREWLSGFLNGNREQLEKDFAALEPDERIFAFSRLIGYIIPKQQAVTVEAQVEAEFKQLQKLLSDAPDDAAALIAQKILELQERNEK